MKILTICQGGAVRSVGLARVLRDHDIAGRTNDAIAASWRWNSPQTLEFLGQWADLVVVMEPYMTDQIPASIRSKTRVCDVGPDRYGNAQHPDLVRQCIEWAKHQGL
jgi:predicted protein tyrosine phosphatase